MQDTTYYKELAEECALVHGWECEERDGDPASWMCRQINYLKHECKQWQMSAEFWRDSDTYRLKISLILAGVALALGLAIGKYWL